MSDDGVQPSGAEGQGTDGNDSGLYDLNEVPEEMREQVIPHLKAMEGQITKKFQEAAEYRKGWQPYEEMGLKDVDPASLKQLLEFAQLANDPDQFSQWWKMTGEQLGLFEQHQPSDELDLEGLEDLSQEKIQELVEEQLAQRLSPIEQSLKAQEEATKEQQASEEVNLAFEKLQGENEALFEGKDAEQTEEIKGAIARLSYAYSEDNSLSPEQMIAKGFEDYKSLIGQGEKGLFEKKSKQPPPAEGPGSPATGAEKITSFDDPRLQAQALERLKSLTK